MIVIKICGIICEYNPPHEGHRFHIRAAKETSDAVVCIMSGNFVQRGENAVFDKFARARAALEAGADAVLELPTVFSLQSAEHFAAGGMLSAAKIGCTHISFGSERGTLDTLENPDECACFSENIASGLSYGNSLNAFKGEPNSMLGKEYIRAIKKYSLPLIPETVLRQSGFLSASEHRELIKSKTESVELLCSAPAIFAEDFFELIKYSIITSSLEMLKDICGVNEGLEYKLKKEILNAETLDGLIKSVKSKRYTYSRISRILFCTLLNIKKENLSALKNDPPALKLLGAKKETGILSKIKNFYVSPLDAEKFGFSTVLSNEINLRASQVYGIKSACFSGTEDYKGFVEYPS